MKTKIYYTIDKNPDLTNVTKEIAEAYNLLNKNLDNDIISAIDGITLKSSFAGKNCLVIFHLKRDQRVRFKKLSAKMIEESPAIGSFYVEVKNQFINVGGFEFLFEKVNGYNFYISPFSPLQDNVEEKFYKEIQFFAPKGRTRNAIVIGTHCGLIPLHIADQYNRVYAIDDSDKIMSETKQNFVQNNINNCLVYSKNIYSWTKEFVEGVYNPPGKVQRIGLMVVNLDVIDKHIFDLFDKIKAETVVMFSESLSKFDEFSKMIQNINYKTRETKHISIYYLDKFKRIEDDNIIE